MIAEFNTSNGGSTSSSGKGTGKVIAFLLVAGVCVWAAHKFWYKPMMEKKALEKSRSNE